MFLRFIFSPPVLVVTTAVQLFGVRAFVMFRISGSSVGMAILGAYYHKPILWMFLSFVCNPLLPERRTEIERT